MHPIRFEEPALTVALAIAAGTLAQAFALKLQVPALVLLLVLGVVLGPEGMQVVHPASLGTAMQTLVGFAVAVILFEGGMNLRWRRVQREDRAIRRLVLGGAWVTAAGGALCTRLLLAWPWPLCVLFGTLVIVTGPTVVTPLLRRLKVEHATATVLEAEGVLIDPLGAIIATSTLDVVLSAPGESWWPAVLRVLLGLGVGALTGMGAGFAIIAALRRSPEEVRNVLTLALVLAVFHVSDALVPESGIAVVTVAGVVVGNKEPDDVRELFAFKEQLTLLLIGMLFVLLAADVQLSIVQQLGWRGLAVVAAMMFVVRPLNVAASTLGTGLKLRQKAFIAWIAPRGIVAAAMASLFSVQLEAHGMAGGHELRALVFLVIAVTVAMASVSGGTAARLLGLRRPEDVGWVLLGANELARATGHALRRYGEDVVVIDTDPNFCAAAQSEGLAVLHADGFEGRTLKRAYIDTRAGAIGCAPSTEANLVFAQRTREEGKVARRYVVVGRNRSAYPLAAIEKTGARVMFGQPVDVDHWNVRLRRSTAQTEIWVWTDEESASRSPHPIRDAPDDLFVALASNNGRRTVPVSDQVELHAGDHLTVLVNRERAEELDRWLNALPFVRLAGPLDVRRQR